MRNVVRFLNGLSVLVGGTRSQMGATPKEQIFKEWKLTVDHVIAPSANDHPLGDDVAEHERSRFPIPVLLVPPLMVRPYVYDVRPDHSMVRFLRDRGFEVYIVDFGEPDRYDETIRLDHYVFTFLPAAVAAVLRHSGAKQVSIVGYCMGGIFGLLYAAAHHASVYKGPHAGTIRNLVTIGMPINFEKMGILTLAARLGQAHVDKLLDKIGNVPAFGSELGFKLMSGTRSVTKWADLFIHLYDEEYVRGFDAINTWVNDMIPYPRDAFKQMVKDVVGQNKILKRNLVLADRPIDIASVDVPLLAFAGKSDNVATLESTRAVLDTVGSKDKTFLEVRGGHVGVVAGSSARDEVWERTASWLGPRSL